jgi:hypothetical protein
MEHAEDLIKKKNQVVPKTFSTAIAFRDQIEFESTVLKIVAFKNQ